jgi:hypothetical protein
MISFWNHDCSIDCSIAYHEEASHKKSHSLWPYKEHLDALLALYNSAVLQNQKSCRNISSLWGQHTHYLQGMTSVGPTCPILRLQAF